jgi:hypothetical protein
MNKTVIVSIQILFMPLCFGLSAKVQMFPKAILPGDYPESVIQ